MQLYRVTMETDDDRTFTADVPAKSKKDARKKAEQLYGEDVTVTNIEERSDDSADDTDGEDGGKGTAAEGGTGDSDGEGTAAEDGEVEILSVEEIEESDVNGGEGDETDDEDEPDSAPEDEHPYFRRRSLRRSRK